MNEHGGTWRVPGYTEVRELGSGASGRVVLAHRDGDDFPVAIKYLSDRLLHDRDFLFRFRYEAELLALIRSPYAARLYEYVEAPGGAAIIMEPVDGVSLRALLRAEGPTGPEAALVVLKGALLGLAAAHANDVVHRDFKPENVLVDADGNSKIVDFGIAVRAGDDVGGAGTPAYMAPEQWSGAPATPATDVYAATVVFFECLTGAQPYRAPNVAAIARLHQVMPPPIDQVPEPLRDLVERGLAKHPADRPPSAEAFADELEAVATAAYGPGWEERGRRRLARLAALFAPAFPLGGPADDANTALAETRLPRTARTITRTTTRTPRRPTGRILAGAGAAATLLVVAIVIGVINSGGSEVTARSAASSPRPTLTAGPAESAEPGPYDTEDPALAEPSTSPAGQPSTAPSTGPDTGSDTGPTTAPASRDRAAPADSPGRANGRRPETAPGEAPPTAPPSDTPGEDLADEGRYSGSHSTASPRRSDLIEASEPPRPAPRSPRPRSTSAPPSISATTASEEDGSGDGCTATTAAGCPATDEPHTADPRDEKTLIPATPR